MADIRITCFPNCKSLIYSRAKKRAEEYGVSMVDALHIEKQIIDKENSMGTDFGLSFKSLTDLNLVLTTMHDITKDIKRVIFNDPATIVIWGNGDKTVVKTQNSEPFDKEKGLAFCIVKHLCGDKGNYNNVFKKWCE